jgi:type II restriction/modification system DNA methylase subunit YeeA
VPREADLVTYWFERARELIKRGKLRRAGLLATQGIRGGANRKIIEAIKQTGDIFWAQSDRDWILDGATVHVSMIGFDTGEEKTKFLNGEKVSEINSDLTSHIDLTQAQRLRENENLSFMGVTPAGPFYLEGHLARKWLSLPKNPNECPNSDVVRPYFNGTDLTKRPRDVWIVDFGVDMSLEDAALYEAPFEFIKKTVYPVRKNNKRASYRESWWLLAESRPAMRNALESLSRYIGTSMVAKHRLFSWIISDVLPANLIIVVVRDDDYFFGLLHSKPHELWARGQGTQLREATSGSRYTPTTTFETFPFPWPPGKESSGDPRVQAIATAARELVEKRDAWLNPPGLSEKELKQRTLTNLYNKRPTWLALAHERLDTAVFAAYDWPHDLTDEQILERLLALNLERAAG